MHLTVAFSIESGLYDIDILVTLVTFLMGQVSLVHKLHHLDVILIFNYHVFIRIIMVLVSGKRVNLGSGECTKLSLV